LAGKEIRHWDLSINISENCMILQPFCHNTLASYRGQTDRQSDDRQTDYVL